MKVKQSPEDFIVEELTDVSPTGEGQFAFYKLEKTGWTTPDALAMIRRRWDIHHDRMSYGGLKDRHAVTTQYLSIYRGPERNMEQDGIVVTYLGRIREPYSSQQIRANRFVLTLRSLDNSTRIETAAKEVAACGIPNYFDDQRFGSVERGGAFIALEMIHGRFEEALKIALAAPYEYDRAETKHEKATLLRHWGDWPLCKSRLERSHARSLVDFLCQRPGDYKGAVARLRPELSGLYLSAYQSHVWNRMLAKWLTANAIDFASLELKLGMFPAPRTPLDWDDLFLPLPSARLKPDEKMLALINEVLAEDGLTLDRMRIAGMQKPYFSRGERAACLRPSGLTIETGADERHLGRSKAVLNFELPRGCYATMVVKRLTEPDA